MRRVCRGFFVTEGMIGIALLAVAGGLLLVGITRHGVATSRLDNDRRAIRLAEATLARLQAKQTSADLRSNIRILPDPAPAGSHWVEVTTCAGDQTRSLIGLTPDDSPTTAPAEGRNK